MFLSPMRFIVLCFLVMVCCTKLYAQQDTAIYNGYQPVQPRPMSVLDSMVAAERAHQKYLADSIAMQHVKAPDAAIRKQYVDRILKENIYTGFQFLDIPSKVKSTVRDGKHRPARDQWLIVTIIGLLIYAALLNITLNKDVKTVFQSFYSKRVLSQAGKEEGYINFWSFVGLFLLFGLTFGLLLYQLATYNKTYYSIAGFRLFISLSVVILILFAVKFLILKFLGFIFDINKVVGEYISILYLTYFNIGFVFLPVGVCFSLLDAKFIPYLLGAAIFLIVVIFTWLYLRSSVNIISNIRFHKFYLIVYLCALEICPILILIKALNI